MAEAYQVVWPSSRVYVPDVHLAPRVKDLNSAVILELNHMHYRGVEIPLAGIPRYSRPDGTALAGF